MRRETDLFATLNSSGGGTIYRPEDDLRHANLHFSLSTSTHNKSVMFSWLALHHWEAL